MAETSQDPTEIKETDIVFDCPYCGKSLAIDYRGAGLSIPCINCSKNVEVPIPEGMELADIDSTVEEQEMRILNLRRSLGAAELRIGQLEAHVRELTSRRGILEKSRTDNIRRFETVLERTHQIQKALQELSSMVETIQEMAKRE